MWKKAVPRHSAGLVSARARCRRVPHLFSLPLTVPAILTLRCCLDWPPWKTITDCAWRIRARPILAVYVLLRHPRLGAYSRHSLLRQRASSVRRVPLLSYASYHSSQPISSIPIFPLLMPKARKSAFYAVVKGRVPGIYTTWCVRRLHDFALCKV